MFGNVLNGVTPQALIAHQTDFTALIASFAAPGGAEF